jgi:hypothetical protein
MIHLLENATISCVFQQYTPHLFCGADRLTHFGAILTVCSPRAQKHPSVAP